MRSLCIAMSWELAAVAARGPLGTRIIMHPNKMSWILLTIDICHQCRRNCSFLTTTLIILALPRLLFIWGILLGSLINHTADSHLSAHCQCWASSDYSPSIYRCHLQEPRLVTCTNVLVWASATVRDLSPRLYSVYSITIRPSLCFSDCYVL